MSLLQKLDRIILDAIKESSAESIKDMGKIMRFGMPHVQGTANGKIVNQRVKDLVEKA